MSITTYCIKINLIYQLNILQDSSFSFCVSLSCATALAEERSQARRFCCFCFGLDVTLFLLWARRCPPLLSTVTVDPMVPYSTSLHRWSALTGAKQHCFRTCRELVKRRWVWNQEKAMSKNIALHVLSFPHAVTSESHWWNVKTGCHAATNKKSRSSLKCICLFLKREGVAFGSGTCCWSIRCDLISLNERHPSPCVRQL